MEGRGRRGRRMDGARRGSQTPVAEEIVPNWGWTEDSARHCLLVDLPGFRKEEVKVEVDDSGNIIVRGERLTNEQKRVHFGLIFPVPMDSDMDNIAGQFVSEILYVHVPKLITSQENKESEIVEEEEAANGGNIVERAEETEKDHHHHQEDINNADDDNEWRGPSTQLHHDREREEKEERKNKGREYVEGFSEEGVIRKWERGSSYGMSRSAAVEVLRRNKGIVITAVIAFSFGLYASHKFHSLTAAP